MRLAVAALVTTIVPTIIGARWVNGPASVRYGLGALVGVALIGLGGMIGGVSDQLVPAVLATCGAGWLLGPHVRVALMGQSAAVDPITRRSVFFTIAVGCCLAALAVFRPIPEWDGWMNWSVKAKALALDGNFYGPVFTSSVFSFSHQDYPPLLPAWHALAYIVAGQLTVSWPLQFQLAWFWTAGAVALVSLTSSHWGRASLFMLAWVCAPQVIYWTMSGYADVPMAFFLLGGVVVLLLSPSQSPVVAGLLLGACALTKVEGLPLAVVAALSVAVFSANRKVSLQALAILLAVRAVWFFFTISMGLSNDVLNETNLRSDRIVALMPRLIPIGVAWVSAIFSVRRWGLLGFAAVAALAFRWKPRRELIALLLTSTAVLSIAYIITPRDLTRHLRTSFERVAIAPMGLLALLVATATAPRRRSSYEAERLE
jgi:hypothetical protein